jgi:D-amino-acid dehydrogenase
MQVTVVGGGIVGVCTAWSLAEVGCDVTVVERNRGIAQETSYGHAGIMAPAAVSPWAAPGMPRRVLATLFAQDAAIRFAPGFDAAAWRWAIRWLGACRVARFRVNQERMQRVASYSRDVMAEWRDRHGFAYERTEGLLQLLRTEREVAAASDTMALLSNAGIDHRLLSPDECRAREPGLSDLAFGGGLLVDDAEAGNCPLFARQLKAFAEERGVRFEFGTSVEDLRPDDGGVTMRLAGNGQVDERHADAVVIATGATSAALLRRLGIALPLYPVKGYSASVAIREPTYAPIASVVDETYRVGIVRLGNRIRIAGTAELGGNVGARVGDHGLSLEGRQAERAFATLLKVARDWFPGAAQYQTASWWVGARPMLPDGPPVLGPTRHPGIFVNLGHGSTGWTMAAGSGRILADVISQRTPEIDLEGLTVARYA